MMSLNPNCISPTNASGLFNPRIQFTPSEWKTLVDNHIDEGSFPGKMMRYVSQVTAMIRHGNFFEGPSRRWEYLVSMIPTDKDITRLAFDAQTYYLVQRLYTFALTVGTILGCVLGALDTEDTELISDLNSFSSGIMALARTGRDSNLLELAEAEKEMVEYVGDFGGGYTKERLAGA
ncbi:hypothetical protein VC83_01907 [Pseudogymnoascus destructans]|uniref:Uncharacterized protein n=1 Tax=Pseudogymnoascus destructans TaxID=655981 RepID=A0A177AGL3_9PEZI|nr:uncharacterized protein VC83_01907 [Pseudogymnoascus destructans]OAF61245.2 hypothetical protein VC83_01907 [Pseudogymnoascus destructans]